MAVASQGPVAPEAEAAFAVLREDVPEAGLLAVTSPDRLHADWTAHLQARRRGGAGVSHIEALLAPMAPGSALVTLLDGHPAALSWMGAVRGQRVVPLGVDRFGQSGDIPALYREYGLDLESVLDACAQGLLGA
jgi:pyruvate dehydrogenase E1 component